MTGTEKGTHSLFCDRMEVIRRVDKHINLSTTEQQTLIVLGPYENPCCNCKVILGGSGGGKFREQLVDEAISWVLAWRKNGHPAQVEGQVGGTGWVDGSGDTGGIMRDDSDAEEVCEVIRIDFKNRRRII